MDLHHRSPLGQQVYSLLQLLLWHTSINGKCGRGRTYDIRFWRPTLYQLSYALMKWWR